VSTPPSTPPEDPRETIVGALLQASGGRELLTVAEAALALRVTRGWLYANRVRLGGVALGAGPKAPIRFDARTLAARLTAGAQDDDPPPPSRPPTARRKRRQTTAGADDALLPVRDRFAEATPKPKAA
jgi:hypothetical protein